MLLDLEPRQVHDGAFSDFEHNRPPTQEDLLGEAWSGADALHRHGGDSSPVSDMERTKTESITTSAVAVDIPDLLLSSPRSCFEPFHPPAPEKSEQAVLRAFQSHLAQLSTPSVDSSEHYELQLDDFAIYWDSANHPCEMRCLHQLNTKRGYSRFFFDGVISFNGNRAFVRRVAFTIVPLGAYGLSSHCVEGNIWLQSELCEGSNVLYKLDSPAKEYQRFFTPFLWVANLAKHFVDFLDAMEERGHRVSIRHFRRSFKQWLLMVHEGKLDDWLTQHPSNDFRTAVVAHIPFLYKEYRGVARSEESGFHDIWAEIWDFSKYPNLSGGTGAQPQPTIVANYIHRLFSHLPFGDQLQNMPLDPKTLQLRHSVARHNGLNVAFAPHDRAVDVRPVGKNPNEILCKIRPGDTISTTRDNEDSGSLWRREMSNGFDDVDRWFALVQKIYHGHNGKRHFEVLWYYRPVDTICGLMKYPWNNELFLSDHCSCFEKHKIQEDEVLGIHSVEFRGGSSTRSEFFCRQAYLSEERKWVSLEDSHMRCSHQSPQDGLVTEYQPGDTLLLQLRQGSSVSEPCEVTDLFWKGKKSRLRCRKLLRRRDVDAGAPTSACNELVYSNQVIECSLQDVTERCHVRFFKQNVTIPTPYDRDGVGCFFYITHQLTSTGACVPLQAFPQSLRQGFNPAIEVPKLRGLDLFCGGGNFGRGLEEGGAITMRWANDYSSQAVHTYMANHNHPEQMSPFLGSIDDFQKRALAGNFSKSVPMPGEVDFISAGSPCPGFSRLTNDKTTVEQRKNQSLVAAFASCVDVYRPKYGLLENVPGIIQGKANRDQDVFSQLMCALVGMGYQAQLFFLHSSSCGSAQKRSRIFVSFAAPNVKLPARPQQTHAHPLASRTIRLGRLPTGDALASTETSGITPFPHITSQGVTLNLPSIYDGQVDTCVAFPDHRLPCGLSRELRARISLIPNRPWGMNLRQASDHAILTEAEKTVFSVKRIRKKRPELKEAKLFNNSSAYGRLAPNQLMATITTRQTPGDHKNGRQLHWKENRGLSIMEARRAQGFPDDEVILGTTAEQYKVVGNSVAREVALALGLSIREAWAESRDSVEGE